MLAGGLSGLHEGGQHSQGGGLGLGRSGSGPPPPPGPGATLHGFSAPGQGSALHPSIAVGGGSGGGKQPSALAMAAALAQGSAALQVCAPLKTRPLPMRVAIMMASPNVKSS